MVIDLPLRGYPGEPNVAAMGSTVFFVADDGQHGQELWKTDGTPGGTVLVKDIRPGPVGSLPSYLAVIDGRLFFSANDGLHGAELWTSDGTAEGTVLLQDIVPGPGSSRPQAFVLSQRRVYFTADDGTHGRELWALPLSGLALRQPPASRPVPFRP
jgi:ELWxxDGT repeat protein